MKNITVWSDQDGCLAEYEPSVYREITSNGKTLFMTPGVHYFRSCNPNIRLIDAYQKLQNDYNIPVYVITNIILDDELRHEHATDKKEWIHQYMAFLPEDHFKTTHAKKWEEALNILNRPLTESDILISDYNQDLIPWEDHGGTGIKYLNGLNSADSFTGLRIPDGSSADTIVNIILSAAN